MNYQWLKEFFHKWPGVLIVSAGLVLLVTGPIIFGGRVLIGDSLDYFIPQLYFYKDVIERGGSPFWNPYNGAGFPLAGSSPQWFNPFVQVFLRLFSPLTAFNILLFLFLTAALFFAIHFLQTLGTSFWPALSGGLAYLIAQVQLANNPAFAMSAAFLPALFLLVWRIRDVKPGLRFWGYVFVGGLAVALSWLSGLYWTTFYALVAGGAFSVFLGWKRKGRALVYFLLIVFIGTFLALVQLVPVFVISQFSARAVGLSYEQASDGAIEPADLLDFFWPRPLNQPESRGYLYMGLVPFVFFLGSFFSFFLPKHRLARFFRWLFLISIFIAVSSSPLFWVLNKLPLFNYFRIPRYFMYVGTLGAVVLSALGFNHLLAHFRSSVKKWLISSAVLLIFIDFMVVYFYFYESVPKNMLGEREWAFNFNIDGARNGFSQNVPPGRAYALFPDEGRMEFYFSFAKQPPPTDSVEIVSYNMATLYPNYNLIRGLENIELYDPLAHWYLSRYLAFLGGRNTISQIEPAEKLSKRDIEVQDKLKIFKEHKGLADFLGIKYLITGLDLKQYGFDLPLIGETIRLVLKTSTKERLLLLVSIYDNPDIRPLVYLAPIAGFAKDSQDAFDSFRDSGWQGVFVECGECGARDIITAIHQDINIVLDNHYQTEPISRSHIELTTKSGTRQFMIMSQTYYPGWKAFVDNREVPAYRVNAVFMGIFVPAGEHRVVFEYRYKYLWSYFWSLIKTRLNHETGSGIS